MLVAVRDAHLVDPRAEEGEERLEVLVVVRRGGLQLGLRCVGGGTAVARLLELTQLRELLGMPVHRRFDLRLGAAGSATGAITGLGTAAGAAGRVAGVEGEAGGPEAGGGGGGGGGGVRSLGSRMPGASAGLPAGASSPDS